MWDYIHPQGDGMERELLLDKQERILRKLYTQALTDMVTTGQAAMRIEPREFYVDMSVKH